jgi:hypothetical protein
MVEGRGFVWLFKAVLSIFVLGVLFCEKVLRRGYFDMVVVVILYSSATRSLEDHVRHDRLQSASFGALGGLQSGYLAHCGRLY